MTFNLFYRNSYIFAYFSLKIMQTKKELIIHFTYLSIIAPPPSLSDLSKIILGGELHFYVENTPMLKY